MWLLWDATIPRGPTPPRWSEIKPQPSIACLKPMVVGPPRHEPNAADLKERRCAGYQERKERARGVAFTDTDRQLGHHVVDPGELDEVLIERRVAFENTAPDRAKT